MLVYVKHSVLVPVVLVVIIGCVCEIIGDYLFDCTEDFYIRQLIAVVEHARIHFCHGGRYHDAFKKRAIFKGVFSY